MVMPFKGVQNMAKDAFNFFHSSALRINIECAFGMLVHWWGILRKASYEYHCPEDNVIGDVFV
jgi:hypothetical protein